MKAEQIYIKAEKQAEVLNKKITLGDIVKIYCVDKDIQHKLSKEVVMTAKGNKSEKYVVSILKVVEIIQKQHPSMEVVNVGEPDIVVSYKIPNKMNKRLEYIKVAFSALIIFFGAAFTIMTFNADVSVNEIFDKIYELFMGKPKQGVSALEISYTIGLPIGIIVFFDHFSKYKFKDDPTPIQIEMRLYEDDISTTLIKNSGREGTTIDSD